MTFVGREKEVKIIIRALERDDNIIVKGIYGIGRTALISHVEECTTKQFRFLFTDFSKTPGQVCHELLSNLFPQKKYRKEDFEHHRYREMRFRIANRALPDGRRHVIVLDNIGRLTHQRLTLIRYLGWDKRSRFIAIVESYVSDAELLLLRAELMPAQVVTFSYLTARNTGELLRRLAEHHRLEWTETQIHHLAEASRGYPLGLRETLDRELKRHGKSSHQTSQEERA